MTLTPRAQQVLSIAESIAKSLNQSYVGQEHMFLAMLKLDGRSPTKDVLTKHGITLNGALMEEFFGPQLSDTIPLQLKIKYENKSVEIAEIPNIEDDANISLYFKRICSEKERSSFEENVDLVADVTKEIFKRSKGKLLVSGLRLTKTRLAEISTIILQFAIQKGWTTRSELKNKIDSLPTPIEGHIEGELLF